MKRGCIMVSVREKVVVITGASSGIGYHLTRVFVEHGARVVCGARRINRLSELVTLCGADKVAAFPLDVACAQSVSSFVESAVAAFQRVDVLINNAGVSTSEGGNNLAQSVDDWDRVISVNLRGTWLMCRAFAQHWIAEKQQEASIINVSSVLGSRVYKGQGSYCASKAAVSHLSRQLALEWARHGIRVNVIAPGYFSTEMTAPIFSKSTSPGVKKMIHNIPMRRIGVLEELNGPMLLLASDGATYMTGSTINVDGGHQSSSL